MGAETSDGTNRRPPGPLDREPMMKQTIFLCISALALALAAGLFLTSCREIEPPSGDDGPAGKTASLSFDSFDGGGPVYSVAVEDPSMASFTEEIRYHDRNPENPEGAAYTVTFTFTGLKPGETYANVSARSSAAENFDARYAIITDDGLNVTVRHLTTEDLNGAAVRPRANPVLEVNGRTFYPSFEDNSSAAAFLEKLEEEGGLLELTLHDYGNFEKVGPLPWELPRNDAPITTVPGDIILYQGDQITIYYAENTWEFTKLGRIGDISGEELLGVLGEGDVTVVFRLEWDE